MAPALDSSVLQRALGMLEEALLLWQQEAPGTRPKPHLRSAVIQSFEFTYELLVRLLRRVPIERAPSASAVVDLSFNDLLRAAADAGLVPDPVAWRRWRELRNITSLAYVEARAQRVAEGALAFCGDARASLLAALQRALAP